MHILDCKPQLLPSTQKVPKWMYGAFRRNSISFADGLTDTDTRVFWLQSENLTIDLRLPLLSEQLHTIPENVADTATLKAKADYEGWYAFAQWQNEQLSWHGGAAYQLHNRWPEPALLQRIGNCMMEFAPSGAYVEDWRFLNTQPGPLIGLELISERYLNSGEDVDREVTPEVNRKGALIICGEYAGLVIDRTKPAPVSSEYLRTLVADDAVSAAERETLLRFETSVGFGNAQQGYRVIHALDSERYGQSLIDMNGFSVGKKPGIIVHTSGGENPVERCFRIDCWYPHYDFTTATPCSDDSQAWMSRESTTLGRYTKPLY